MRRTPFAGLLWRWGGPLHHVALVVTAIGAVIIAASLFYGIAMIVEAGQQETGGVTVVTAVGWTIVGFLVGALTAAIGGAAWWGSLLGPGPEYGAIGTSAPRSCPSCGRVETLGRTRCSRCGAPL